MKDRYWIFILSFCVLLGAAEWRSKVFAKGKVPSSENKTENDSVSNTTARWRGKMQELYKVLSEIMTDASSERRFNAQENKARIERNVKKLSERAHDLTKEGVSPDLDPTVKILAEMFQDETKRAYWAFKSGNRSYSRGILNQVSSLCISCHTRTNSGQSFPSLPLEPNAKDLMPIEKGRFYAATRQYDRASDIFLKITDDSLAPVERPIEWEQALRYGLAIAIRVKKDPDQALSLIERVIVSKKSPFYLKQDALKWKESVEKWKAEIPHRALTEEGLFVEAVGLITQSRELQKYPMDHSADIQYLRATAVIHELLQKYPDGRHAQEALMMAGMCYDVLRAFNIEDIYEVYFEACIRKTPHTATAEACYRRYEQSTYEGYTGSSGTFLPGDVLQKLKALEMLAHPLPSEGVSPN